MVAGALTITVCATTAGAGCTIAGVIAFSATTLLDAREYQAGEITTAQFAAETAGSVVLFGGFKLLPQILAESGLGVYAFYAQIGEEFSGSYRALTELSGAALDQLVSLAAKTCPTRS